jgi:hypothetical protein
LSDRSIANGLPLPDEHRTGAERVADAAQLPGQEVERLFPADGNEFIAAAAIVGARTALEPATADRRLGNAHVVPQGGGEIADDAVWIGIARIRSDFETGLAETRREYAPVRSVWLETVRQVDAGIGVTNRIAHSAASFAAGGRALSEIHNQFSDPLPEYRRAGSVGDAEAPRKRWWASRGGGGKMHELVGIDVDRLETIEAAAHLLKSTKEDGKEGGQVRLLKVDRAIRLHAPTKQCAQAKIQYSLHELTGPGCLRPERSAYLLSY